LIAAPLHDLRVARRLANYTGLWPRRTPYKIGLAALGLDPPLRLATLRYVPLSLTGLSVVLLVLPSSISSCLVTHSTGSASFPFRPLLDH
jgi:hypothetical protein